MRIVHIVPGTGGTFYCGNCLRDGALVRALRRAGHDVVMAPLYLPLAGEFEVEPQGVAPLFFGAVSVYAQERFPGLRPLPRLLRRLLDSSGVLKLAAARAGSTRAAGLAEMTLSMLRGEEGNQAAELERLMAWLKQDGRPDIVHLSNALLLGLARRIRRELRTPVVCTLQDEDTWIDAMDAHSARRVWETMAERAVDVQAFVAVSRYASGRLGDRLGVPAASRHIVHLGIELEGYPSEPRAEGVRAIGYLSRMSESMGLGILADAFLLLKQEPELRNVTLRAMGGHTADDAVFLKRLRGRLTEAGVAADVEFLPGFDRVGRMEFLRSLSVLSVPAVHPESFGAFVLEALAAGVPVVEPDLGAFPEIVELTGGGTLYRPNNAAALSAALSALLLDPARAQNLGRRGQTAVKERFNIDRMAQRIIEVYSAVAGEPGR